MPHFTKLLVHHQAKAKEWFNHQQAFKQIHDDCVKDFARCPEDMAEEMESVLEATVESYYAHTMHGYRCLFVAVLN